MRLNFDVSWEEDPRGGYNGVILLKLSEGTRRKDEIIMYRTPDRYESPEIAESRALNKFLKRIGF